jgi:hypothetical protein
MVAIIKLADHPRRKALMDNLTDALAPGQLEREARKRIAQQHEEKVERYRSQIKFYVALLAGAAGENATDEWLTQCMSKGVK